MTGWLIVLAVIAGLLAGVAIGRMTGQSKKRVDELRHELEAAQAAYLDYRAQVTEHFARTADLVNELAANSRKIIRHLADGSQALCEHDRAKLAQADQSLGQLGRDTAGIKETGVKADNPRTPVVEPAQPRHAELDSGTIATADSARSAKSPAAKAGSSHEAVVKPDEGWYEILPEQEEQREKESVH